MTVKLVGLEVWVWMTDDVHGVAGWQPDFIWEGAADVLGCADMAVNRVAFWAGDAVGLVLGGAQ